MTLSQAPTKISSTMDGFDKRDRDEVFSNAVRAGKRTYFFDVKRTRNDDYYLTITESKKRFSDDGKFHFEKHKIFLYKEDFEKFSTGLTGAIDIIKDLFKQEGVEIKESVNEYKEEYSDVTK